MRKIEGFIGYAPKLKGEGEIGYHLWISETGELYVQMIINEVDTKKAGTFNGLLFLVAKYIDKYHLNDKMSVSNGICPDSLKNVEFDDNNPSAFLKAVLRHMFPQQT
ncbi:hypothetical protein [Photobacterium leiognathi]|uniref:hypothetical protein n=1 Tax=Photobacterium leiognathi TaxID=553611 RepID=UPI00273A48AC|nr:hypothetical protein [Photobacterium leiognathi]